MSALRCRLSASLAHFLPSARSVQWTAYAGAPSAHALHPIKLFFFAPTITQAQTPIFQNIWLFTNKFGFNSQCIMHTSVVVFDKYILCRNSNRAVRKYKCTSVCTKVNKTCASVTELKSHSRGHKINRSACAQMQ